MDLSKIIEIAGPQVPALLVLVLVVKMFLDAHKSIVEAIRNMHQEHMEARTEVRLAIDANSSAINKFSESIRELSVAVASIPMKIKGLVNE